jgi:hypothetical protein
MTRREIEDLHTEGGRGVEDLAKMAEELGYRGAWQQLMLGNGTAVSSITNMLEDNPGMIRAIYDFVLENDHLYDLAPEEDEEEDEEKEAE